MTLRKIRVNQDILKLNGTHQLLVYVDDVNILDGSIHTVKENTESIMYKTPTHALFYSTLY